MDIASGSAPTPPTLSPSHGHEDSMESKDSEGVEGAQTMVVVPKDSGHGEPLEVPRESGHVEGARPPLEPAAKKRPRGRPPKSLKDPSEGAKKPKKAEVPCPKACPKAKGKSNPKAKAKAKTKKARIKCWAPFILYRPS